MAAALRVGRLPAAGGRAVRGAEAVLRKASRLRQAQAAAQLRNGQD